jgi:predicted ATPase
VSGYFRSIWWVDLAPVAEDSIVAAVLAVVGSSSSSRLHEVIGEAAAEGPMLLVLDNCEHVIDEAAGLAETVVQACASVTVLATSREALRIDGEVVWRLAPLAIPEATTAVDADSVGRSEAAMLFVDRAMAVDRGLVLDDGVAASVARIVTLLDGLPLAIELAAAALAEHTAVGLAELLEARFASLPPGRRTAPDRHRTIWATIEWSYDLLEERMAVLFARLAAFTGDFSVAAATAVCGEDAEGAADVQSGLRHLEERSLVHLAAGGVDDRGAEAPRFRMLETVREFGRAQLRSGVEDPDRTYERLVRWACDVAEPAGWALDHGDDRQAIQQLDRDYDNLRGALRAALDRGIIAGALDLVGGLGPYWHLRGLRAEGRAWVDEVLDGAGDSSLLRDRPRPLLAAERIGPANDFARRCDLLERARTAAVSSKDPAVEAMALAALGLCHRERGDRRAATAVLDHAVQLARGSGDAGVLACALERLCELQLGSADPADAVAALDEATEIYRALSNRRGELWCLAIDGMRAHRAGDHQAALTSYARGLELAVEIGYADGEAWMRTAAGSTHLALGALDAARDAFARAHAIHLRTADDLNIGWSIRGLARVALAAGDPATALRWLREGVRRSREPEAMAGDVCGYAILTARLTASLGDRSAALDLLEAWEAHPERGELAPDEAADLAWVRDQLGLAPDEGVGEGTAGPPSARLLEVVDSALDTLGDAPTASARPSLPPLASG